MMLKELREAAGLSRLQVANRLGISVVAVRKWENGVNKPSADKLPDLADLYTCSIDALYGRGAAAEPSIAGEEGKRHAG